MVASIVCMHVVEKLYHAVVQGEMAMMMRMMFVAGRSSSSSSNSVAV